MHLDFEFFQFTNTMCVRIGIKLCDQKGHMAVNSISTNGMHVCEARGGSGHTRTTQHRAAYQMDMYIETERTRMSAGFFERFIDGAGECRHNEHSRLICRTKRHSDFGS